MASRRKPAERTAVEEAVSEGSIISPLEVSAADRDAYWNGLFEDPDQLRAATSTTEFFPLLHAIPLALWEKRLMVYIYRTAPKVKNQAGERAFIEKIAHAFDEEYVKANHGGGSYICYLNLDRETQLKQCTFSIDGPPKFLPGQTLVDSQGNPIAPAVPPPAETKSELSQAIAATADANKIGLELIAKGSESAIEMQQRVFEKAAGLSGNNGNDKLLELLIAHVFDKPKEDPTVTALTLMDKLESIIARRMPAEPPAEKETPLSETLEVVSQLTGGQSLPDLIAKKNSRAGDDWVSLAIGAAAKLIENGPTMLQQIFQNQERQFQRQLALAQFRAGHPSPQPGAPIVPAAMPGPPTIPVVPARVHEAPPAPFVPAAPVPGNGAEVIPMSADIGTQIMLMVRMVREKFAAGYSGSAVAQALDVMFPDLFDSIAPTVLNEQEMDKFIASMPDLQSLTSEGEWPEFRADFVQFVRDEYADEFAGSDTTPPKPVAPAATA